MIGFNLLSVCALRDQSAYASGNLLSEFAIKFRVRCVIRLGLFGLTAALHQIAYEFQADTFWTGPIEAAEFAVTWLFLIWMVSLLLIIFRLRRTYMLSVPAGVL